MKATDYGIPLDVELTLTPRPDQIEAFNTIRQWQHAADYSQVGTGKSLVSYLYIMDKLASGKKVLVVMPPALIPQYVMNFEKFAPDLAFTSKIIEKDRATRHAEMDEWDNSQWPDMLFMSYQLYLKYFKQLKPYKVLVADEAHAVSNVGTKNFQSMFMHVWSRNLDLLLMTATPTTTELETAYGQIRLRSPEKYASFGQFQRMHCIYAAMDVGGKLRKQIVGYKDIGIINTNLMEKAIRRRAVDVLSLTEPTIIDHNVVMSREHAQLYRELLEAWVLEKGDELLIARNQQALRQMALQIITNVEQFTEDSIEDAPMANLLAIVESIDLTKTKLIIFCNFQGTVRKLARVLKKYNPALVYGDGHAAEGVEKLQNDESCRVGILNFQSGSSGFNLQHICHHAIIYEAIGSPGLLEQAIGRIHRGGQENPVIVWIFRYCRTKSERLFNKNLKRAEDIKQSLADPKSYVDFIQSETLADVKEDVGLAF